jgi:hypothetical protein
VKSGAGFLLLTLLAYAAVLALSSAASAAALRLGRARLARLAPAARARILFAAAWAPAGAALCTTLALASDILVFASPLHCAERFAGARPSPPALAVLLLFVGAAGSGAARALGAGGRAVLARRRLRALSSADARGFRVLRSDEAHAFVLGLRQPEVYVSAGLLRQADPDSLETVLAHERAHVRRRDPLRRLAAALALSLHLPGVAGAIGRALRAAEEASADADAARALGDGTRVAAALVRFARMRLSAPLAVGFHGEGLEARVREVLADAPPGEGPGPAWILGAAGLGLALSLLAAPLLHLGVERLLELASR